mmetsp:Transcript_102384/g.285271  ORF Transcript_102384/g.285271 Transcript_102384/m.285271 type:complete len:246 (-) Transcript_102384:288-1025(-)
MQHCLAQLVPQRWRLRLAGLACSAGAGANCLCGSRRPWRRLLRRLSDRRLGHTNSVDLLRLGCGLLRQGGVARSGGGAAEVQVDQSLGAGSRARDDRVAGGAKVGCPLHCTTIAAEGSDIASNTGGEERRHKVGGRAPAIGEEVTDVCRNVFCRTQLLLHRLGVGNFRVAALGCVGRYLLLAPVKLLVCQPALLNVLEFEELAQFVQVTAVGLWVLFSAQAVEPLLGRPLVAAGFNGIDLCWTPL